MFFFSMLFLYIQVLTLLLYYISQFSLLFLKFPSYFPVTSGTATEIVINMRDIHANRVYATSEPEISLSVSVGGGGGANDQKD